MSYSKRKITQLFSYEECVKDQLNELIISNPEIFEVRKNGQQFCGSENLSKIGSKIGFLPKSNKSKVMTFFTTKGGVLKTTLALNYARLSALHGLKTLIIGLDMQGDITSAVSDPLNVEEEESVSSAISKLDKVSGLYDFFQGRVTLDEIIKSSDLPTLSYITETPELVFLNDSISNLNRREFWLNEKVIKPLKEKYDLIILDCSPNWNRLTTNALCSSDLLVSPIECKINNFRNLQIFNELIREFKEDLMLDLSTIYVPTKYSNLKKLSREIKEWYFQNMKNCCLDGVKEGIDCEEAMALRKSVIEYRPTCESAKEMKRIISFISEHLNKDCIHNSSFHEHKNINQPYKAQWSENGLIS